MLARQSGSDAPFPAGLPDAQLAQELAYTLRKIEQDFSNYSAWHQRQLLFARKWEQQQQAQQQQEQRQTTTSTRTQDLARERALVLQAMYTDPADQSVWLYHRWLVAQNPAPAVLDEEIAHVEELLEVEPDSKCE